MMERFYEDQKARHFYENNGFQNTGKIRSIYRGKYVTQLQYELLPKIWAYEMYYDKGTVPISNTGAQEGKDPMKTTVYFIRHAEPNFNNHDDMSRELSAKGMSDRKLVTRFLADKDVTVALSSPYRRAIDTISDFTESKGLDIATVDDFRERKVGNVWLEDLTSFQEFCRNQWADFNYRLPDGESLGEVQKRNISALNSVLKKYRNQTIIVGSHGTALSTVINFYDRAFGYSDFEKIRTLMPWVVKFTFQDDVCAEIRQYNLFSFMDRKN